MRSRQTKLLAAAAIAYIALKDDKPTFDPERWAHDTFADDPFKKLVGLVGLGALLFYRAELGHNPKVKSYWDALVYSSTCASVGYGDIFAQTPVGKAVGSFLMTVGPAMTASAFTGRARDHELERAESHAMQREILETLHGILEAVRASSRSTSV